MVPYTFIDEVKTRFVKAKYSETGVTPYLNMASQREILITESAVDTIIEEAAISFARS
jgi:hypothetical protein